MECGLIGLVSLTLITACNAGVSLKPFLHRLKLLQLKPALRVSADSEPAFPKASWNFGTVSVSRYFKYICHKKSKKASMSQMICV